MCIKICNFMKSIFRILAKSNIKYFKDKEKEMEAFQNSYSLNKDFSKQEEEILKEIEDLLKK